MLSRWLKLWKPRNASHRTAMSPARRPECFRALPSVECLEDRVVPILFSTADLQLLSITAGNAVNAGASVSFVATVKNNGPSTAFSVKLSEHFSGASFTGIHFTPSSGTYNSSTGNWTGFSLGVGHTITLTATGTLNSTATGQVKVSAALSAPTVPPALIDPNPGNNSLTTNFAIHHVADLEAFQEDNTNPKGTAVPGSSGTLTVVVFNAGPSTVNGATVTDNFPASLTNHSWSTALHNGATITTGSGTGNINTSVSLPPGAFVIFTISATIDPAATGTLANTATIAAPSGVTDPKPGNNSATDTLTLEAHGLPNDHQDRQCEPRFGQQRDGELSQSP